MLQTERDLEDDHKVDRVLKSQCKTNERLYVKKINKNKMGCFFILGAVLTSKEIISSWKILSSLSLGLSNTMNVNKFQTKEMIKSNGHYSFEVTEV